jgi:hypothetical protein
MCWRYKHQTEEWPGKICCQEIKWHRIQFDAGEAWNQSLVVKKIKGGEMKGN